VISPWYGAGVTATTLGVSAVIWVVVVQWLSSALGGFLAGRLRHEAGSPVGAVLAVAAGSFIGTSIFALSGLVLHDRAMPVGAMGQVILLGVFLDVVIAALLLPGLLPLFRRLSPPQAIL